MRPKFGAMCLVLLLFILQWSDVYARPSVVTIDIKNANLAETIRIVAKILKMNVIISPTVAGRVTLYLQDAMPEPALDLILASQGLAKWMMGNVWFIAPQEELIKRKQAEMKWKATLEEASPLITHLWQIKYGKAEEIARILKDSDSIIASKRGRLQVDARTNVICLQATEATIKSAKRLIERLDVPVKQILIQVRLVSLDTDFERALGIHFAVRRPGATMAVLQEAGRYSIAVARLADGSLLDVKLSALEDAGHAELISNPSLFTANQQQASIESGEEVPYQEVSESGGTAVVFKKAVLGLKVTPQVLPGNQVLLQMQINQDRPGNRLVQGVPTINTRQIITNVLVKHGDTLVLGGIYETTAENGQERIPFISQLPLIGVLFADKHQRHSKRELLVFVTPRIMTQDV